jgi:predicted transposase YdaD
MSSATTGGAYAKKERTGFHSARRFFRQTLQRPGVAAEFLRLYLPEGIVARLDLRRVTLEEGAFVDEKLRRHFSDMLYRVGVKGGGDAFVFFLLEHKSAPDERVVQLLRYMALAWDRLPLPLPLIIPVVVYHGAAPWRVSRRLSGLFAPSVNDAVWREYLANPNE